MFKSTQQMMFLFFFSEKKETNEHFNLCIFDINKISVDVFFFYYFMYVVWFVLNRTMK